MADEPRRCVGCGERLGATHRPGCPRARDGGGTRYAVQARDAIEGEAEKDAPPTLFD